jgi:hypothetical protein
VRIRDEDMGGTMRVSNVRLRVKKRGWVRSGRLALLAVFGISVSV